MPLSPCKECGGTLRRSRRNFVERLVYAEAFRCEKCTIRTRTASWNLRYVRYVKCPRCHSVDLTILKRRDPIDRMQSGLINFLHKLAGGTLYHCWFCRLQFYDMRPRYNTDLLPDANPVEDAESHPAECGGLKPCG